MPQVELTSDDALLVEHYRLHWLEMGVGASDVRQDWHSEAHRFLREARAHQSLAAFVAMEEHQAAGTACCHFLSRTYPAFRKIDAAQVGYVWGVYVRPEHRGRRIGEALVLTCMSHLKSIGCGRVLLHAGERSAPLYRRMGFEPTDELSATLL
jgi:GNAT superfamily N-acetyltransferase